MTSYRIRIGEAIAYARNSVGKSQQEVAAQLGRDKRTLQKWEKGEIRITLEDFLLIFDVLQLPAGPYAKWVRHPELFPRGLEDVRRFTVDSKRAALTDYYARHASPVEIEQQYYILFSDHGSNYYGMLQERVANLQTPLRDRRRICGQIIASYKEAAATGNLTNPEGPQPNLDILSACYEASIESIRRGENRYSIGSVFPDETLEEAEA